MAFNGSGTFVQTNGFFTGSNVWAQDKAAGVNVVASRHDTHDQDIANGLTNCITKDGQSIPTANIPMGGFKITGLATGTANTDAVNVGQIQNSTSSYGGLSTGAANTYAVTLTPPITSYVAGQRVQFKSHLATTGASTLNVNAIGAAPLLQNTTLAATVANTIPSGEIIDVIYDGTNWQLQNQPAGFSSDWLPAAAGTTTMTYTGVTDVTHKFQRIGKFVYCSVDFNGTTGGVATGVITFNLPFAASASVQSFIVRGSNVGSLTFASCTTTASATLVNVQINTGANWSLGAATGITGNFIYEALA